MEERLRQLEAQLEEKNQELLRVSKRKEGKSAVTTLDLILAVSVLIRVPF